MFPNATRMIAIKPCPSLYIYLSGTFPDPPTPPEPGLFFTVSSWLESW